MEFTEDKIDFPMHLADIGEPPVTPPTTANPSPSAGGQTLSSSTGTKRSWVWNHFEITQSGDYLLCKVSKDDGTLCNKQLNKDKSGSTKNMRNHLISIHKLTEPHRTSARTPKHASNAHPPTDPAPPSENLPPPTSLAKELNFIPPSNLCQPIAHPGPALNHTSPPRDQFTLKAGLAQMLKGGVIMDVTNVEQARIAEEAGAVAVMALERVPSDIRKTGGVARMSDPQMIKAIKAAVSIPVMAKVRIGHFVEAQILQALNVDYIDESEVLTPADPMHHIDKHEFHTPFVCGCRNLGEALRRINEGAAMIRTKGEAGTGNVIEAVRHARTLLSEIRYLRALSRDERYHYAKDIQAPLELLNETARLGRLPVVNFAAGGIATPADAAMMMQLGMDGVFVGSGIFKSSDPLSRARAIVQAVTHYRDPAILAQVSENLGEPMLGIDVATLSMEQTYALRGH